MDINRLTQKSQDALHDAQTAALRLGLGAFLESLP